MKQLFFKLYGFVNALKYPYILKATLKSIRDETVLKNRTHIKMAADWLLYMQNEDGGYSRKFSFVTGRDKSYIETTGYIVQTLLQLKEEKYIHSALWAGEWLLKVQNEDGSFSEIDDDHPFVFDTGQVLLGLNRLYLFTKDVKYLKALEKAASWLVSVQEEDGSWQRYAYNSQKHTYYSRVAVALYEAGEIMGSEEFKHKAEKTIIVTGNTVIDALFLVLDKIEKDEKLKSTIIIEAQYILQENRKMILVMGHRRENFGERFIYICEVLAQIVKKNSDIDIIYLVYLNPNVQKTVKEILSAIENISLIKPLQYESFVYLMSKAYFLITDSGGIQEKAPSLGKPVLVMRDTTERPEALAAGTVKLEGTNSQVIVK